MARNVHESKSKPDTGVQLKPTDSVAKYTVVVAVWAYEVAVAVSFGLVVYAVSTAVAVWYFTHTSETMTVVSRL
jgi:hypothetical protein